MSSFKNEEFDNEISYRERLVELFNGNYDVIDHGYNEAIDIYWITYFVREYVR